MSGSPFALSFLDKIIGGSVLREPPNLTGLSLNNMLGVAQLLQAQIQQDDLDGVANKKQAVQDAISDQFPFITPDYKFIAHDVAAGKGKEFTVPVLLSEPMLKAAAATALGMPLEQVKMQYTELKFGGNVYLSVGGMGGGPTSDSLAREMKQAATAISNEADRTMTKLTGQAVKDVNYGRSSREQKSKEYQAQLNSIALQHKQWLTAFPQEVLNTPEIHALIQKVDVELDYLKQQLEKTSEDEEITRLNKKIAALEKEKTRMKKKKATLENENRRLRDENAAMKEEVIQEVIATDTNKTARVITAVQQKDGLLPDTLDHPMTVAYELSVRAMLENPGLFITDEIVAKTLAVLLAYLHIGNDAFEDEVKLDNSYICLVTKFLLDPKYFMNVMKAVDSWRVDRSDEQIIQQAKNIAAKNIQRAFRARLQRKKIAALQEENAELKQQLKLADASARMPIDILSLISEVFKLKNDQLQRYYDRNRIYPEAFENNGVVVRYNAFTSFEMPAGVDLNKVHDWFVKWNTLYYRQVEGGPIETVEVEVDPELDQKFPAEAICTPYDSDESNTSTDASELDFVTEGYEESEQDTSDSDADYDTAGSEED